MAAWRAQACPFFPACSARLLPPQGEKSSLHRRYPVHQVQGDSAWFGRCPGSGLMVTVDGWVVEQRARVALREAGARWLPEMLRRMRAAGQIKPAEDVDLETLRQIVLRDGGTSMGHDAAQPVKNYYPGRPADAPEPAPGEAPVQHVPMDLGGGPLGEAAVENARDQLIQMSSLAIAQIGQAQDVLSRVTAQIEGAQLLAATAEHQVQSAVALVQAAVGNGTIPAPAALMRNSVFNASSMLQDNGEGVLAALTLARERVDIAFRFLNSAAQAGYEYRAMP